MSWIAIVGIIYLVISAFLSAWWFKKEMERCSWSKRSKYNRRILLLATILGFWVAPLSYLQLKINALLDKSVRIKK